RSGSACPTTTTSPRASSTNTLLEPEQDGQARRLAREIADGLSSGRLEPTAGALEPLADAPRSA
ncbi:MAG: hypothetical protein WD472_08785, partial [Dehalococcoidia bacterium]